MCQIVTLTCFRGRSERAGASGPSQDKKSTLGEAGLIFSWILIFHPTGALSGRAFMDVFLSNWVVQYNLWPHS